MKRLSMLVGLLLSSSLAAWGQGCSAITGGCTLDSGNSNVCNGSSQKNTNVTYKYNCSAACTYSLCTGSFAATPGSSTDVPSATGQCGEYNQGVPVSGAVSCPPVFSQTTSSGLGNTGTNNLYAATATGYTQSMDLQHCLLGTATSWTSSCTAGCPCVSPGGPCPETCDGTYDPGYTPASPNDVDTCTYPPSGCEYGAPNSDGTCCEYFGDTPILIDVGGQGFELTNVANGVNFDFLGNGHQIRMAWTAPNILNAWLALDRDGNGRIDSGKELFGNITEQPSSKNPNGFLALAVFDDPKNGGNGDGVIDSQDKIFPKLLLWIDKNHNGISEPGELMTISEAGITSISLTYHADKFVDSYGNQFRYRAQVMDTPQSHVGHIAYDVILQVDK